MAGGSKKAARQQERQWEITKTDRAAHALRVTATLDAQWEQWFLLTSDWHLDSPHCDRRLLRSLMEKAKERGAIHLVIGDALDLMQGKYDPRSNKADLRPEYIGKPYLQAVLDDWSEFVGPFADQMAFVTRGNHCQSVARRVEWDVAAALSERLRIDHGARTITGAYAGYLMTTFEATQRHIRSLLIAYDHGSGGGGPVTRGVIGTNRRAAYIDGRADWVIGGHIHERWHVELPREHLLRNGRLALRTQHHLCLGGFKEERLPGVEYHVERGRGPKPLGGYWARVYVTDPRKRSLGVEFITAN